MANRRDYFFRQKVTEAELDVGFNELEQAEFNLAVDNTLVGVSLGMDVTERSGTPDLNVEVATGTAYSKQGERIRIPATQLVDVSQDDAAVSTAVGSGGNEKIVSVFALFDRALSDPRLDGNSVTVFFVRAESFQFSVIQGAEAGAGTAVPPALDPNKILLADITRTFGQTQILNGDIDISRREDMFNISAGGIQFNAGTINEALTAIAQELDNHITGVGVAHPTSAIDGAADTVGDASVTATTLDNQINEILAEINDRALRAGDTFTGAVTHQGAVTHEELVNHERPIDTAVNAALPRMLSTYRSTAGETGEKTLLAQYDHNSNAIYNRKIYLTQRGLEIVQNATWNAATDQWSQDSGSDQSYLTVIGGDAIRWYIKDIGAPDWNGNAWDRQMQRTTGTNEGALTLYDGKLAFDNTQSSTANDSNPPHIAPETNLNTVKASLVPKAWGRIEVDNAGLVTLTEGYNFSVPSDPGASSIMTIPFVGAMDDAEYCVVITPMTSGDHVPQVVNELAASFGIQLRLMSTAATQNYDSLGSSGIELAFVVFAKVAS